VLDLEARSRLLWFHEPFEFGLWESPFRDPTIPLALSRAFPTDGYECRTHEQGRYLRRPLIRRGEAELAQPEGLSELTLALARQLQSASYRDFLAAATGLDLTATELEAWFWRYDHKTLFVPHQDAPSKLLTHVLYLNEVWPASAGGRLRILNSENGDDIAFEITPALSRSSLIRRSESSWHLLSPIAADAPGFRQTITIHFHVP